MKLIKFEQGIYQNPTKFLVDGTEKDITPNFGTVIKQGTPFSAENFNEIVNGLAFKVVDTSTDASKITVLLTGYTSDALTNEFVLIVKPANTNSGALTISINAGPEIPIVKETNTALVAKDVIANNHIVISYDTAGYFKLINQNWKDEISRTSLGKTETAYNSTRWGGRRVFSTLTELGLTAAATVEQLINALPVYSELKTNIDGGGISEINPYNYTNLIVVKNSLHDTSVLIAVSGTTGEVKTAKYDNTLVPKFSGWSIQYTDNNYGKRKDINGNYTLTNEDHGRILCPLDSLGATNITIFIPTGLKEGFECGFIERLNGTGYTLFSPLSGVTLYSNPDDLKFKSKGTSAHVYIEQRSTNMFTVNGDLEE